jgi:hypothetical protein
MKHKVRLQQSVHEAQGCSGKVAIGAESDAKDARCNLSQPWVGGWLLRSNEEPRARESERDEGGCAEWPEGQSQAR